MTERKHTTDDQPTFEPTEGPNRASLGSLAALGADELVRSLTRVLGDGKNVAVAAFNSSI